MSDTLRQTIERALKDVDDATGVDDSVKYGAYGVGMGLAAGALRKAGRLGKAALAGKRTPRAVLRGAKRQLLGGAAAVGTGTALERNRK